MRLLALVVAAIALHGGTGLGHAAEGPEWTGEHDTRWDQPLNWRAGIMPEKGVPGDLPRDQGGDYAWSEDGPWQGGGFRVPSDRREILIPGDCPNYPVVDEDMILAGRLRIQDGAQLAVDNARLILVGGPPGGLVVEADAQLVLRSGATVLTDATLHARRLLDPGLVLTQSLRGSDLLPVERVDGGNLPEIWRCDIGPDLPVDIDLVNIAPYADRQVIPYAGMTRQFVDPDDRFTTFTRPESGSPLQVHRYRFRFDRSQSIAEIKWNSPSSRWALRADTNGDGTFNRIVALDLQGRVQNGYGSGLARTTVRLRLNPAVSLYAIELLDLSSVKDDVGANVHIYDIQISVPAETVRFDTPHPHDLIRSNAIADAKPMASTGEPITVSAVDPAKQLPRGYHIEPWMFNLDEWINTPVDQRPPMAQYEPFTRFVEQLREHHANTVSLWPPRKFDDKRGGGVYELPVLWPSEYERHHLEENVLEVVAEAFEQAGIRFMTSMRVSYAKSTEAFPVTPTRDEPAAFISRHDREYLAGINREQAAAGVAGVAGIGFDEQMSRAVNWPHNADDTTRHAFAEQFGVEVPPRPDDSLAYRKWVVFGYQQFADYLGEAAEAARAANPEVLTKSPVHLTLGTLRNDRLGVGIAEDVVAQRATIDFGRAYGYLAFDSLGHYVTALATKISGGGATGIGTASLHNPPWFDSPQTHPGFYRHFPPVYALASPISAVMHGGKMPLIWRWNLIFRGGYNEPARQSYAMLDTLSAWGLTDATPPRQIAVLRSRASEDWWQLRQRHNERGNPLDQARGHIFFKNVAEILLTRGYPFDVYYMEDERTLAAPLEDYSVLILPFAYSVDQAMADRLAELADGGTAIMLFEQLGSTDAWGRPHGRDLLRPLLERERVMLVDADVPRVGQHERYQAEIAGHIEALLGEGRLVHFDPRGNDVELATLEKNERERFVALINWTDRPVQVEAGIHMPPGTYQVDQATPQGARELLLDGGREVGERQLAAFTIALDPGDVRVLYVHPLD